MKRLKLKYGVQLIFAIIIVCIAVLSGCVLKCNKGNDVSSKQDKNYYIGENVISDSLSFKVTSVNDESLLGNQFIGVTTENNFILVTVIIYNAGDTEKNVTHSDVNLYKGVARYEPHSGGKYVENGFTGSLAIGFGITKTITFVFETPTKSYQDEYILQVKENSVTTANKIILREKA